ncbi:hypothetical protein BDV27DRAFT_146694 [Aspergillus caelatus]|uniref:N-acetyltransferase domain-containing protein n=2 Tax=Aspergillus subgen. Circumdati TaxID=2720871 RepID=A0A5N6ZYT4_9EURO|nr:uncharacterized protein BDV27DRAFT_146694 [Aspergillus caelatus]KAE8362751.1 hypothetical protein BDV27DRAFT_146694 [Aspergillus caelatus]KAE8410640.1 hypothetical protein BDV36DRAFT_114733 [Aspergillus pseudocaelatus]
MSLQTDPQCWSRNDFLISTDKNLLSIPSINHAFGQDFMYWVNPVPDHILESVVDRSFCFGLYKVIHNPVAANGNGAKPQPDEFKTTDIEQIGFARLITDNITFAYLTDLYVLPEYQGLGLGGWLIDCVNEVLSELPYLRWVMLRTSVKKSKDSYTKRLGMGVLESGDIMNGPVMMGKKGRAGMA